MWINKKLRSLCNIVLLVKSDDILVNLFAYEDSMNGIMKKFFLLAVYFIYMLKVKDTAMTFPSGLLKN